jgi:hypothetical protein
MRGTTVRASCPNCDDITVSPEDVSVRVCTADESGTYAIRCPVCSIRFSKPASPSIVTTLVAAGASLTRWDLPSELLADRPGGAHFTDDDAHELRSLLDSDGWFAQLESLIDD